MSLVIRKIYYNYEEEEKWLNEMSAKGLSLIHYSWCKYTFEETLPNEYTYRIQLLENSPTHAESISYIKFLEETGVEYVAHYMRWIYLRKKSSEGAFDIFTDIDSKISHYTRINIIWNAVMILEFLAFLLNIISGLINVISSNKIGMFNLFSACIVFLLGILFLYLGSQNRLKIKKLKKEKFIRE